MEDAYNVLTSVKNVQLLPINRFNVINVKIDMDFSMVNVKDVELIV